MTTLPAHVGVVIVALLFGVGVWLAHKLSWLNRSAFFWFSAGAIMLAIAGLVVTGADKSIARWLWPLALDHVASEEFQRQMPCNQPRHLGLLLLAGPIILMLVPVWLREIRGRLQLEIPAIILLFVFISQLYASLLPEKVAHLVFSEKTLKVPSHRAQVGQ